MAGSLFFFPEKIQINHVMFNEPVNHALTRKLCTLEKVFWPMPAVTGHRNEAYRSLTNCRDAISNSDRKESIPCWTTYVLISWSPQKGALPGGTSDKCSHGRTWRCFWRRGSSPVCGKKTNKGVWPCSQPGRNLSGKMKWSWNGSHTTRNRCKPRSQLCGYAHPCRHPATNKWLCKMRKFSTFLNILGVVDVTVWPQAREEHTQGPQAAFEWILLSAKTIQKMRIWFPEKSQPSTQAGRWQGGSAAHLLQQAAEIPWDAQLPGGMCVTPICPSQKPLLLLPAPWDSVPKARWMITSNPFLLAKCFILHIATDPSLADMSINSLTQNHVTDGPSSPQTKGRKWC